MHCVLYVCKNFSYEYYLAICAVLCDCIMILLLLCVCVHISVQLADLRVDADILQKSLSRDSIANRDPCLIDEGCLVAVHPDGTVIDDSAQRRQLVRFSTRIWNTGDENVHIGRPPMREGEGPAPNGTAVDPWWEYAGCHGHYHIRDLARHELFRADTGEQIELVGGMKTGFCMRDNVCRNGASQRYTCNDQGITTGCADHYGSHLPCQWIDFTDVPPGLYKLRVTVNVDRFIPESNYTNNAVVVQFDSRLLPVFVPPLSPVIYGLAIGATLLVCSSLAIVAYCYAL